MTPKFTTPCYVRIEDADKRNDIYAKLDVIGRDLYRTKESEYIFCFNNLLEVGIASSLYSEGIRGTLGKIELERDGVIGCGTNIELFLALASMRSDTDEGQWFVCDYGANKELMCNNCEENENWIFSGDYRRATAAEIIEHFKTQEK